MSRSNRPVLTRAVWLAGASLLVLGSTSALAANECGPPPPGGGTVTCPAGNYPNGIDYDTVEDLTVVLEPGVVTQQTVELTSAGAGVELSLQGPTDTSINSSQSGVGVGEGVLVVSTNGTVAVAVDDVRTTGANLSTGIFAYGGSGVSVGVDTVGTIGTNSIGIFADSYDGSVTIDSGTVTTSGTGSAGIIGSTFGDIYSGNAGVGISSDSVTTTGDGALGIVGLGGFVGIDSGTVVTSGDGSGGILAVGGTSKYVGGPPVGVSSDSVTTTGAQAFGIRAIAQEYGAVSIDSGSVATSGDGSGGIEAESEFGSIRVTSDSVDTEGADSTGILATVGFPPFGGHDILGFARIDSGSVITSGDRSRGIDADAPYVIVNSDIVITGGADSDGIRAVSTGFMADYTTVTTYVTSGSVTTTGDRSTGIHATSDTWDTRVVSTGTVSTAGDDSFGIRAAAQFGFVTVDSATVQTSGNGSTGIHASSEGGRVTITSDSVTTTGDASRGIEAEVQGFVATIESGAVSTSGDDSDGIRADGGQYGWVDIDSGSVVTGGDGSAGIEAESGYGNLYVTSDSVVTTGDDSHGLAAATGPDASPYFPTGLVEIDSGTIQTSGDRSRGINAYGAIVYIDSGTVTTQGVDSTGIHANSSGPVVPADGDAEIVRITSGSVTTNGDSSLGISAYANFWDIAIASTGTVSTAGDDSTGISASSPLGWIDIDSATVVTSGDRSAGIVAIRDGTSGVASAPAKAPVIPGAAGGIRITSGSVTTGGDDSPGILAENYDNYLRIFSTGTVTTTGDNSDGINGSNLHYNDTLIDSHDVSTAGADSTGIEIRTLFGDLTVDSDNVATAGDRSLGIDARSQTGAITVTSGTVVTHGAGAAGIFAETTGPASPAVTTPADVSITSASVTTTGDDSPGIEARSALGSVHIDSGTVSTGGDGSGAIVAEAGADATVTSTGIVTAGAESAGIDARSSVGDVTVDSGSVVTSGPAAAGILARTSTGDDAGSDGVADITSVSVATSGDYSRGISAYGGSVVIESGTVSTGGSGSAAIYARSFDNDAPEGSEFATNVTSGSVTTTGANSSGIVAQSDYHGVIVTSSGTVATEGDDSRGIDVVAAGPAEIQSATVTTEGASSIGIRAESSGDVAVTSGSVTTQGDDSAGIHAQSNYAETVVTSTGTVATTGANSVGIYAGGTTVTVTSTTVTTTGAGSTGILAVAAAPGEETDPDADAAGGISILAVGPGGTSVTSGSVTTTGANSPGIEAHSALGDTEVISTGTVSTSGADSPGILASSDTGFVTVDANAVTAAGAGSNAIDIDSATSTSVTIRGLVQSGQALALQADGGAATVAIVAGGTLRGRVDLTDNADTLNNAGVFDAIGTSQFGAGSDLFGNAAGATVRSVNGAATLAGLETFNNSGLVEMRDGAVGDSLSVSGTFAGQAGSTLGLDVDFAAGTADRLIVGGAATGSTTINVQGTGNPFAFNPDILVVDAGAGTQANAFTLAGAVSSPYIGTSLRFDPAAFNFFIVSGPNQPVFETVKIGGIVSSLWYKSADAVDAQLQTSRDGGEESPGDALRGESGAGIWVQAMTGKTDREAVQSFTIGGTSASFDLSYEEEFQGLQGGVELGAGPLRFGVTGGFGEGDAVFDVTGNRVEFDVKNIGAYAVLRSGGLWANGLVKMDWIDLTTEPGAGLSARFDARSFGAMVNLGYRAELGLFFVEPSAGIAWVKTDIDSYQSGGATVDFDDAESLRAQAGLRVGASFGVGESATLTPYVGVRAFDELRDGNTNRFTLGATLPLADDSPGTHGRAEAGFSLRAGNLEAFVRGELDFAGDTEGKSIRGGVRLRF